MTRRILSSPGLTVLRAISLFVFLTAAVVSGQTNPKSSTEGSVAFIVDLENRVEVLRSGANVWDPARTNQLLYPGDQMRTGERSRATVRLSSRIVMRVGELSLFQVPAPEAGGPVALNFLKGILYFFHRDRTDRIKIRTPVVSAVIRGTEFVLKVEDDGTTYLNLLDGLVGMTNDFGGVHVQSGEQGVARPGIPPMVSAMIKAEETDLIEWCLYYPGVLYPGDLRLPDEARAALQGSFEAYRSGDLKAALAGYPAGRVPTSATEKVYRAALWLAVGKVEGVAKEIDSLLSNTGRSPDTESAVRLGKALKAVIAAVKFEPSKGETERIGPAALASEWLAESYYQQSRTQLERALFAARQAVKTAPDFAFAWARIAELELSFGNHKAAAEAVARSLELAPRNAQAVALNGFLLAGRNRISDALASFDKAIELDGGLGNAWLGRGLCLIHQRKPEEGLQAIQVAATVEPQRAMFRSYLGKAFNHIGRDALATHELELAQQLDPSDPTPWLYSALIEQQRNRINNAVRDLEHSQARVSNRRLVRSSQLIEQDRAVGGANLATIYRDNGMTDLAVREASRAVSADYSSYRAHLFLADSYTALFDPRQINLRYETAAVSEYLIANLLAPVGTGPLSPLVTQQDYARLFEVDRFGFVSSTEYLSRGDWLQSAGQYGILGNSSYLLAMSYDSRNGDYSNDHLERLTTTAKFKHQLTPQDSLLLQVVTFDSKAGDVNQYYDPASADSNLRVTETQYPLAQFGYHRAWSPSSHTLFLAGFFQDTMEVENPDAPEIFLLKDSAGNVIGVPLAMRPGASAPPPVAPSNYKSDFEGYTVELQQIVEVGSHDLIGGARFQFGWFDTMSRLGASTPTLFANSSSTSSVAVAAPPISADFETEFQRLTFYTYDTWHIAEPFSITVGVGYDQLYYPRNFRSAPLSDRQLRTDQWSPKAGISWHPRGNTSARAAYSRALGGVGFDQSFRLEPTQVAGINQAFRSLIPESVAGTVAGSAFDIFGISIDHRFETGTYFGLGAGLLHSDAERYVGTVDVTASIPLAFSPSTTKQTLDYYERDLQLTVNQIVGKNWALEADYRLSEAELDSELTGIPDTVTTVNKSDVEALLHRVNVSAFFNHESGLFGQADSIWTSQSNRGYSPDLPGDNFWQFNLAAGYRFRRRVAEIRLALLNVTDQDYRLNPLNLVAELPRARTLAVRLQFAF